MPEETTSLNDAAGRRRRFCADVQRLYTEAAKLHKQIWEPFADREELAADEIRALILQLNRLPELAALAASIRHQPDMLLDCAFAYHYRPDDVESLDVSASYHELALSIGAGFVQKLLAEPLLGRALPFKADLSQEQVESVLHGTCEPDTPAYELREILWTASHVTDADYREGFYYSKQIWNELQHEAVRAAELAGDGQSARVVVSVTPPQVSVNGSDPISIDTDSAACLEVVLAAKGDWVGGPEISKKTGVARPDRALKRLAKKLGSSNPVETRPRIGHRIAPKWLF